MNFSVEPGGNMDDTSGNPEKSAFTIRRFTRASGPRDFEAALALRMEVFVEEQNVPVAEERDEYDDEAWHWLLSGAATGEPLATGRMLSYQEVCQARPVAKIGRIAVKKSRRGEKLGDRIMRDMLLFAEAEGFEQSILDAQTQVIPFYEKLGFVKEGFEFQDAGIPHYRMRLVFIRK